MGITQLTSRSASWQTQIHAQTTSYTSAQTAQAGEKKDDSTDLYEMMRDAREKADAVREKFNSLKPKPRYGDAPIEAYARLARARRQITRLKAAKHQDPDNAKRIQAAISKRPSPGRGKKAGS